MRNSPLSGSVSDHSRRASTFADAAAVFYDGDRPTVSGRDTANRLRMAREELAAAEDELARTLREEGQTWEQIGDCFGMTRQAAHARWAR